jgi:hypothetical protein
MFFFAFAFFPLQFFVFRHGVSSHD